ncbi:MAG TPA: ribosome biogenesis GTP-binding protein YihA/YsxC [Steroidobacteraceae bacterium]
MSAFPNAKFLISAAAPEQYPADRGAEVAFAGRSNAGKSSALNAILGRQGLARTSKTPGRTRLINFFELSPHERIVDLPGYGYASAPASERRTWPRLLEALRAREALRGLFVIVDARRGIAEGDEALLAWTLPRQRVHVLLSKADKLSRNEARQALAAAAGILNGRATVQLFSAHARTGLDEAQDVLRAWLAGKEKTPMTSDEATGAD